MPQFKFGRNVHQACNFSFYIFLSKLSILKNSLQHLLKYDDDTCLFRSDTWFRTYTCLRDVITADSESLPLWRSCFVSDAAWSTSSTEPKKTKPKMKPWFSEIRKYWVLPLVWRKPKITLQLTNFMLCAPPMSLLKSLWKATRESHIVLSSSPKPWSIIWWS